MTKFITSGYIFLDQILSRFYLKPTFFPAYHVSFNLMSRDTDIISADISIFADLAIFVMSKYFFELEMMCFVTLFFML